MEIAILSPGDEAHGAIAQRLVAFNRAQRPSVSWRTDDVFTVVVNDEAGRLRGGARGVVRMGAVEIRTLWLDEDLRRRGLGERIVRAAEDEGRRRGARAALLDTYDFQARGFYESLGYACFASFDFPDGVKRFYMSRSL
jgi:GNAT superfamily N-acetyltransferase